MKDLLLHNWHLKLISLVLATALWAEVARTPTSEISVLVPLWYQNIPPRTEVFGDTSDRIEVRLRGSSALLRTLSAQDVSLSIDLSEITVGQEKVVSLNPEMVHAPFGIEVVGVIPARVRLTVEPEATRVVRIVPALNGVPAKGFEIDKTVITPDMVEIEGPSSHVLSVGEIHTTAVDVDGKGATFRETVELDIDDPVIRAQKSGDITVEVRIRPHAP